MFKWDNLQKSNIEQLEYLHGKVGERINWNLYLIICMAIYQFVSLGFFVYGKFSSLIDFVFRGRSFLSDNLETSICRANIKERDDWMTQVLHFEAPEE